MYKGSQSKRDFMRRVGSHSTKGDPTRGVVFSHPDIDAPLPSEGEINLAQLKDLKERLLTLAAKYPNGQAHAAINFRIGEVKKRIKALNAELDHRLIHRSLFLAINEKLEPELARKVLDRAREIRMAGEAL